MSDLDSTRLFSIAICLQSSFGSTIRFFNTISFLPRLLGSAFLFFDKIASLLGTGSTFLFLGKTTSLFRVGWSAILFFNIDSFLSLEIGDDSKEGSSRLYVEQL